MVEKQIGDQLLMDTEGKEVQVSHTADFELTCLYFSAHWCPPCRVMTPKLVGFYKNHWKARGKVCVIFISFDRDEETMMEYFEEMPWLAIPFGQRERSMEVASKFEVDAIPSIILLKKDGEVVTKEGYQDLLSMGEGALDHWLEQAAPKKPPTPPVLAAYPPAAVEPSQPSGEHSASQPADPDQPDKPALTSEDARA